MMRGIKERNKKQETKGSEMRETRDETWLTRDNIMDYGFRNWEL